MEPGGGTKGRGTASFVVGCIVVLTAIEIGMRLSSDHVAAPRVTAPAPSAAPPEAATTTTTALDVQAIALEITAMKQKVAGLMSEKVGLEHQIRIDSEEARRARSKWLDAAADAAEARQVTARERIAELTREIDALKNEIAERNQAAVLAGRPRRPPAGAVEPSP